MEHKYTQFGTAAQALENRPGIGYIEPFAAS
jgi:hypothetical protein